MWLVATGSTDMEHAHHHKNFCSREKQEPPSVLSPESGTDESFLIYSISVSSQSNTTKFKKPSTINIEIIWQHLPYQTFRLVCQHSLIKIIGKILWIFFPYMTSFQVARSSELNICNSFNQRKYKA